MVAENEVDLCFDYKVFSEDDPVLDLSDDVKRFDIVIEQRKVIKYDVDFIRSMAKTDAKPLPEVARRICFLFPHNQKSKCLSTHESRVKDICAEVNKVTAENIWKVFKHLKGLINTRKLVQVAINHIVENAVLSQVLMDPLIKLCEMLARDSVCASFADPIGVVNSELLHNLQQRFLDRKWLLDSTSTDDDVIDKFKKKKVKYKNTVILIAKLYALRMERVVTKLHMPEKSVIACLNMLKSEECNYNENFECIFCILDIAGKYLDSYANAWLVDSLFEWFKEFTNPSDNKMAHHNKVQFIPEICELRERKWAKREKNIDVTLLQKQKPKYHSEHR